MHDHRFLTRPDDPIDDPATALVTFGPFLARTRPAESLALSVDLGRRLTTVIRHPVGDPDDVFELAVRVSGARAADDVAVILLTCRPGAALDPDDAPRWSVLDDLFHGAGLRLVEWFVFGRTLDLPRRRAGVASRWTAPADGDDRSSPLWVS